MQTKPRDREMSKKKSFGLDLDLDATWHLAFPPSFPNDTLTGEPPRRGPPFHLLLLCSRSGCSNGARRLLENMHCISTCLAYVRKASLRPIPTHIHNDIIFEKHMLSKKQRVVVSAIAQFVEAAEYHSTHPTWQTAAPLLAKPAEHSARPAWL